MEEIKLYKSRWRAIKLLLLSVPFVVIGIWMIMESDSSSFEIMMGWISVGFFGLGIPISIFHFFDTRPQIIINEIGIFDRTTNQDTINWEIIEDAYLVDVHNQKFICLVVNDKFDPSILKGKLAKKAIKLNKALGFQELNISLGQIKIDEVKFIEFIKKMCMAEKSQRNEIIKTLK